MNAWFSPEVALWSPFLSLLAIAAVLEPLAERGQREALVKSVFGAGAALGVALFAMGAVAVLLEQPWYVVFPLLWSGAVAGSAFLWSLRKAHRAYRAAEGRRILAKNL